MEGELAEAVRAVIAAPVLVHPGMWLAHNVSTMAARMKPRRVLRTRLLLLGVLLLAILKWSRRCRAPHAALDIDFKLEVAPQALALQRLLDEQQPQLGDLPPDVAGQLLLAHVCVCVRERECVCVCLCVCARACAHMCKCVRVQSI